MYSLLYVLLFTFLTSVSSKSVAEYKNPCYVDRSKADFSYDDIVKTIKTKNIRSIEMLMPELPECFRSRYTLVHDSRSLQEASAQNPRAILFNHDAKLSCSFNGDEKQRGFDSLECYQYRDRARKFEFFEIEFPSERNHRLEVEFSLPNMRVDRITKCTSCHSQDPRPNWESYSRWPGVYGEFDDNLVALKNPSDDKSDQSFREKDNLLAFKVRAQRSDRYRHLKNPIETKYAPYRSDENFHNDLGLLVRPNALFTMLITPLVAQRNARILESKPRWFSYQYLRQVVGCEYADGEKTAFPEFIHLQYNRFTYDLLFKNISGAFEWTPFFRSLSPNCTACLIEKPIIADHLYSYNSGAGDFNKTIANLVLQNLISTGDKDLKPYHKVFPIENWYRSQPVNAQGVISALNLIDENELKKACSILYEKFKASYTGMTAPR